jgi:hypothetical protein
MSSDNKMKPSPPSHMAGAKQIFVSPNIRLRIGMLRQYLPKCCHRRCTDAIFPSLVLLDCVTKAVPRSCAGALTQANATPDLTLAPQLTVVFVLVRGKGDGWASRSSIGGRRSLSISDLR